MVSICLSLLKEPMLEEAIRAGDCLAMLVEYFHGAGRMQEAYDHLQDMESRNIALHPYVDAQILEEVFKAVGASDGRKGGKGKEKEKQKEKESAADRSESKQGDEGNKARSFSQSERSPSSNDVDENNIDSDIEEDMADDSPAPAPRGRGGDGGKQQAVDRAKAKTPSATSLAGSRSSGDGKKVSRREEEELDEDIDEVRLDAKNCGVRNWLFSVIILFCVVSAVLCRSRGSLQADTGSSIQVSSDQSVLFDEESLKVLRIDSPLALHCTHVTLTALNFTALNQLPSGDRRGG